MLKADPGPLWAWSCCCICSCWRDQALRDPRANSPRLSLAEKLAAAIGGGCFLDERLPDGSVQRRPGRWQTVKAASANTDPFSQFKGQATVNICVKEAG